MNSNSRGAYGEKNQEYDTAKKGPWFIDYQKVGADAVVAGIYKEDTAAIDRGLKIIGWGLAQQQQDGSFSSEDPYHNGLLFLESVSRALLHLESSQYQPRFAKEIESAKARLRLSIEWLIKPEIEAPGLTKDEPYTHRYFVNASAIGIAGVLLKRADFIEHSKNLLRTGIARQCEDGSNPEKGGTDTSYHALGLLMAARYYSIVADEELRKPLKKMGELGSQWLAEKVLENGAINSEKNTRTGSKGEMRHGTELKTVT
ncbi:MAG: hypothetical protein NDJ90_04435 [Oligoflexia bacterium]|nr:hypothetical protein [Oligoflexia bacterium]